MPENLNELLQIFCRLTNAHICIHDVAGVLDKAGVRLDETFRVHAKPFCDAAKSTKAGYACCTGHRIRVNRHADSLQMPFEGCCPFGLYEISWPVKIDGRLACIVFVGHLIADRDRSCRLLHRMCMHTASPVEIMERLLPETSDAAGLETYRQMAAYLAQHIADLCQGSDKILTESRDGGHWAVNETLREIHTHYDQDLTLKDLARLYFLNEKHLGRLFLRQTGRTFHQYLLEIRLAKAEELLKSTRMKAIDVAEACGFNSVAYFNRTFSAVYGVPPARYRKQVQSKPV